MFKNIKSYRKKKFILESILVPFILKDAEEDISLSIGLHEIIVEGRNKVYGLPAIFDEKEKKIKISMVGIQNVSNCLGVNGEKYVYSLAKDIVKQIKETGCFKPKYSYLIKVGGYPVRHLKLVEEV